MPAAPHESHTASLGNQQVQQVVANRSVIDQAKGALVLRFRIDPDAAFELLRAWAAETNSTPLIVAQTLVHGVCLEDATRPWDPVILSYVAAAMGQSPPSPSTRNRVPRPRPRWGE
jgi:hypothetical protein